MAPSHREAAREPLPASLYLHIPWCLSRCPYCDFNVYAARTWPEEEYTGALVRELEWFTEREPFGSTTLGTVFFGGGTPSLFSPASIERILRAITHRFETSADLEVTLEANPGTVDAGRLGGFRDAGVNRLSLGLQTFQPRLLEALGRRHDVNQSREALEAGRKAGFDRLSLDLMYAIPTQTRAELEDDLVQASDAGPDHVSAYALIFEPGTPLTRELEAGRIERLSEKTEAEMYETVGETLGAAGLVQYEISNYCLPGQEARHNQAYWRGHPYLGLGAGAHCFAPHGAPPAPDATFGVRWQNERDPARYREKVERDGHAIAEHETLSRGQALGEFCWLRLRENRGLDRDEFRRRFDAGFEEIFPHVADLRSEGLLEEREGRLALSSTGRLLADSVFASFF